MEFLSFPPRAARDGTLEFYLNGIPSGSSASKIMAAIYAQDTAWLKKLLADKASFPDKGNIFGLTPLMMAAARNYKQGVELLLAHPLCSPDKQTIEGWTALHFAAECKSEDACRILLSRLAARDIKNYTGETAEDIAKLRGCAGFFSATPEKTEISPPPPPVISPPKSNEIVIGALLNAAVTGPQGKFANALQDAGKHFVFEPSIMRGCLQEAMRAIITAKGDPSVAGYIVRQEISPQTLWDEKDGKKHKFDDPMAMKTYKIRRTFLHEAFARRNGTAFREMMIWCDKPIDGDVEMYYRREAAHLLNEHLRMQGSCPTPEDRKLETELREIAFALRVSKAKRDIKGEAPVFLKEKFNRAVQRKDTVTITAVLAESTHKRFLRGEVKLAKSSLLEAADLMRKEGRDAIAIELEKKADGKSDPSGRSHFIPWAPFF